MATTRHCPVSPLPVSWLLVYEVRQEMTSFYILGRIRDLVGYSAQLAKCRVSSMWCRNEEAQAFLAPVIPSRLPGEPCPALVS